MLNSNAINDSNNARRVVPVSQVADGEGVAVDNGGGLGRVKQGRNELVNEVVNVLFGRLCELPDDVLGIIFGYTDYETRLALRVAQVRINQFVLLNLNIIVKIDINKLTKINELFTLVSENGLFCNWVRGFDFGKICINNNTKHWISIALNSISKNARLFSNFTTLIIGDINIPFDLDIGIDYITNLSIGKIDKCAELNFEKFEFLLADSFKNLTTLSLQNIYMGARLELSGFYPTLETLSIGTSLKSLIYGIKGDPCQILLSGFFDNLTILTIENINTITDLKLPGSFNRLKTLSIGHLYDHSTLYLSGAFNSLETFIVGHLQAKVSLKFPDLLGNLETLTLGNISVSAELMFSDKVLPKLKTFKTGDIDNELELPNFPRVETIELGEVRTTIILADLKHLQSIKVKCISSEGSVILVGSFDSLVKLELDYIDGKLILPGIEFLDYFEDKDKLRKMHNIFFKDDNSVVLTSKI